MAVLKFDHLYVESQQFDAAVRFWSELGFEVVSRWGEGDHRACVLRSADAKLVLAEVGKGRKPQGPTIHFAIGEAEAMNARLGAARDVAIAAPLEATHWGTRWIRVIDPDGNLYCLETGEGPAPVTPSFSRTVQE